ncbi:Nn.00g062330.m01.CDS01 [Neocucurbitaria sp. VM-36]
MTASSSSATATVTSPPALPSSAIISNQTRRENGTTNACQAEFESWAHDSWYWIPTRQSNWISTETYDYPTTLLSTELSECTQTCGTICYAGNITTIISTSRIQFTAVETYGEIQTYPVPPPNCTVGFDDCLSIQTSWSSAITSYSAMPWEYQNTVMEPPPPACSACISTGCTFVGMFGMSLYYWPVTTPVSRDYCASEPANGPNTAYAPDVNHTYVPTTSGPYAVVNGITMYQGNVYISYYEPRVKDNCHQEVTRRSPGHNVLTIASTDLHSIRKFPHVFAPPGVEWDLEPWPVNYDDFNPPTPYSAYAGQRMCAEPGRNTSSCTIVNPHSFFPYMLMPPQIRDLDANWKNCRYDKYAAFDPPIALHTRAGMFSSIVDAQPTSIGNAEPVRTPHMQPAPGQSGGNGVPVATARPGSPEPIGDDQERPSSPSTQLQEPNGNAPTPTGGGKPNAPVFQPTPVITIGPSVIAVDPTGGLIIKPGTTLRIGDPPVIMDGTAVSVGPSGIVVVDAKGTSTIPTPDTVINGGQLLAVGSSIMSIDPSGALVINSGFTLHNGDLPVSIDGTTISVGPSGVVLIDAKGTSTIPNPNSNSLPSNPPLLITVGTSTYTVLNNELIMGPRLTLSISGAAAILAGTTVSIASDGVVVVSSLKTSIIPIESKGAELKPEDEEVEESGGRADKTGSVASGAAASVKNVKLVLQLVVLVCGLVLVPIIGG